MSEQKEQNLIESFEDEDPNLWLPRRHITLKCLSIGTPNTTTFPFVPKGKWWLLGVPIFEHIIIRL